MVDHSSQYLASAIPSGNNRILLKSRCALTALVGLQLALALFMILFESIADGLITGITPYGPGPCSFGTGIWVGVFGVITAGLGIGAFGCSPYGNKCLMVSHLVMCIITTIADVILISFATGCILFLLHLHTVQYYDGRGRIVVETENNGTVAGLMANESLMLIAAIIHFILAITSAALTCRNFCCIGAGNCCSCCEQEKEPPITVVQQHPRAPGAVGMEVGSSYHHNHQVAIPQVVLVSQQEGSRQIESKDVQRW